MKASVIAVAAIAASVAGAAHTEENRYIAPNGSGSACTAAAPCRYPIDAWNSLGGVNGTIHTLSDGFYSGLSTYGFAYGFSIQGTGPGTQLSTYAVSSASTLDLALTNVSMSSIGGSFAAAGSMLIDDVTFRKTSPLGFYFAPSGAASLTIRNSSFHDASTGTGAAIRIVTGGHNVNVTLDNVKVSGGIRGIVIDASGGGWAKVTIKDSTFTNIIGPAIYGTAGSGNVRLYLDNVTATNSNVGVVMAGANSLAWMTRSTIAGNATGIQQASGSKVFSYKNNYIFNNGTDGVPLPTSPSPAQGMPSGEIASALK